MTFVGVDEANSERLFESLHNHLDRSELGQFLKELYHQSRDDMNDVKEQNGS